MVQGGFRILEKIYRLGFSYKKIGVTLLDLNIKSVEINLNETSSFYKSEDWFIQIGAFKNKLNAHIAAKKARNAAPEQLGNLPASLQKVNKPLENLNVKRALWRVRFIELAENQARSVCAELWSSGLSCIPLPQKSLN